MNINRDEVRVAALERRFANTLAPLHNLEKEVEGRRAGLKSLQDAHHGARVRLQIATWEAQGKRLCPECEELRGAKTFVWLYLVDYPKPGIPDRRIVLCCRQCEGGVFRPKAGSRRRYHQATRVRKDGNQFLIMTPPPSSFEIVDLRPYRPLAEVFDEETLKRIRIVESAPKFEVNDPRFAVGRDLYAIK